MTHRRVLLIDLVDDAAAIARYEAWHAPGALPRAIAASFDRAGILAMTIHRTGNRLVMVMDTADGFDPAARAAADAADPAVREWEALMNSVQVPLPGSGATAKWTEAAPIFSLAEQLSTSADATPRPPTDKEKDR